MTRAAWLTASALAATAATAAVPPSADSMALAGDVRGCTELLLRMLDRGEAPADELLYRLVGVFHGSGMEAECVALLDSLEGEGHGDLTGWKVSALDLGGLTEEALPLAGDDPYLAAWLRREGGATELPVAPPPGSLAERVVAVMAAPDGAVPVSALRQAVIDAPLAPRLAGEVMDELEPVLERAGDWWDELALRLSGTSAGGRLDLLLLERRAHLWSEGQDYWREVLEGGGPGAGVAAEALLLADRSRWGGSLTVFDALLETGRDSLALALLEASSDHGFRAGARLALLREQSRWEELLALADSVHASGPDTLAGRAALFRARALRGGGSPHEVYYSAYLDFAAAHPLHPTASEAAYIAARYLEGEGDWGAAADAYLLSLGSAGGGFGGAGAYWRGGLCHYMDGRGGRGDSLWREGMELFPWSAWWDEMAFWSARYAARSGDADGHAEGMLEVAGRCPREFYGLLAAERSGAPPPPPPSMPATELRGSPLLSGALEMTASGYGTMAAGALYGAASPDTAARAAALALLGEHPSSLRLLRAMELRLRGSGTGRLPDSLLRLAYPAPFLAASSEAGARAGVDPPLLLAVMRQESYFDRLAGSRVGASGLMQLMPGTAGDIARWYGLEGPDAERLRDPETSILFGALYLGRQLSAFDGVVPLALAAYNAGPGNASRWLERLGYDPSDPELLIERISITETRNYVKHVITNYLVYRELL